MYMEPLISLVVITMKPCSINNKAFTYILASRRSCFRAGTRYYMRGVDLEGHAANYVESEQIIECDNNRCSLVQVSAVAFIVWCWSSKNRCYLLFLVQDSNLYCYRFEVPFHFTGVSILTWSTNQIQSLAQLSARWVGHFISAQQRFPVLDSRLFRYIVSFFVLQSDGFEKHFAAQIYNYGKQVIINLVRTAECNLLGLSCLN